MQTFELVALWVVVIMLCYGSAWCSMEVAAGVYRMTSARRRKEVDRLIDILGIIAVFSSSPDSSDAERNLIYRETVSRLFDVPMEQFPEGYLTIDKPDLTAVCLWEQGRRAEMVSVNRCGNSPWWAVFPSVGKRAKSPRFCREDRRESQQERN